MACAVGEKYVQCKVRGRERRLVLPVWLNSNLLEVSIRPEAGGGERIEERRAHTEAR